MKFWQRLGAVFFNQVAMSIVALLLFIHITTMFFYLQDYRANKQVIRRDTIIQKIINAIYLVEATPNGNRKKAVNAMADPDLLVTLTARPSSHIQFHQASYWKISRALRKQHHTFSLSIAMGRKQWLNFKETLYAKIVYEQLFLLGIEILSIITILAIIWSVHRYSQPLKEFKLAAEQLGVEQVATRLDIYGPKVVREASHAMNQMQQRIIDLIRGRTQMLAAISHDLRTPITRLQLRAHMLDDEVLQRNLFNDLNEMKMMIDEVLAFAREDVNKEEKKVFDLVSLLSVVCDDYQDIGVALSFESGLLRAPMLGKPLALKRAFNNIINNARRYGQHVWLSIEEKRDKIEVLVKDDGPGIDAKDIDKVFEPFYRAEKSRNKDTGGVGLGLAITQEIISQHQGSIHLTNLEPSGLQVKILFTLK